MWTLTFYELPLSTLPLASVFKSLMFKFLWVHLFSRHSHLFLKHSDAVSTYCIETLTVLTALP